MQINFSSGRTWALLVKEFIELVRDPITLMMMICIPIVQSILFAFAINDNPKHLPTVIIDQTNNPITRSLINDLQISSYFEILPGIHTPDEINHLFRSKQIYFAIFIPPNFIQDLIRGNTPELLVEADGSSAETISYALSALNEIVANFFNNFSGPLEYLRTKPSPINLVIHPKFNPDRNTQYNIVPGTITSVLTLTLVIMTTLSVVRERESGTFEILLTTPVKPIEIILGKMTPYIIFGYMQMLFCLALAYYVFKVPINGSITLLLLCCFPFILANLALGIFISTIANNQFQALEFATLYFTPSLMFSGFVFPFIGLPHWGQMIGNILPSTHFLVIIRGIMLKGSSFMDLNHHIYALLTIILVLIVLAITRFHKTL